MIHDVHRERVERLLGKGVLPHVFAVYNGADAQMLLDKGVLDRLRSKGFGSVVFWEKFYRDGNRPTDGHYLYRKPSWMRERFAAVRAAGLKVVGYTRPLAWREAGLDHLSLIDEMDRHEWDGVFLDHVGISHDPDIVYDFCARVRARFPLVAAHLSLHPLLDPMPPPAPADPRANHHGPYMQFFTHTRTGETNAIQPTMSYFRHMVSHAGRADTAALGTYRIPSKWWSKKYDKPGVQPSTRFMAERVGEWMPCLPGMLCASWASFGGKERRHVEHYMLAWRALQVAYADDPEGVLALLPEFPPKWSWESDSNGDQ